MTSQSGGSHVSIVLLSKALLKREVFFGRRRRRSCIQRCPHCRGGNGFKSTITNIVTFVGRRRP